MVSPRSTYAGNGLQMILLLKTDTSNDDPAQARGWATLRESFPVNKVH